VTGRIERRFAALRAEGRTGLVTYLTAGDPDPESSARLFAGLPAAGADLIEIGMPFSDPMADGPVIQEAGERALQQGMTLRGPPRPPQGWQAQGEGGYTVEQFDVDWAQQRVRCPQGKWAVAWWDRGTRARSRPIFVEFALEDCQACPARALCTRAQQQGRRVGLPPQDQYEALRAAQMW